MENRCREHYSARVIEERPLSLRSAARVRKMSLRRLQQWRESGLRSRRLQCRIWLEWAQLQSGLIVTSLPAIDRFLIQLHGDEHESDAR